MIKSDFEYSISNNHKLIFGAVTQFILLIPARITTA